MTDHAQHSRATGVEVEPGMTDSTAPEGFPDTAHGLDLSKPHLRLTQVILADATDQHNELVQEQTWLLHPSQRNLQLRGNLFVVEDPTTGTGSILVKKAPLPDSRPLPSPWDLRVTPRKGSGFRCELAATPEETKNSWEMLKFSSGEIGCTRVLHTWQRDQRPKTPAHTLPRLLVNTWGDRSRDSRIEQEFIAAEIAAVRKLGGEILQLDDGWQRGITKNSAFAAKHGGVWEGFWKSDPRFWEPHPERLPNGLEPILRQARDAGIGIGLWFAPDSAMEFAQWERDVACVVSLHQRYGVDHIKIDGVKTESPRALENFLGFVRGVLRETDGRVAMDLDITAGIRPGYFGAMETGPLFVENRYTDWHNYWPHHTLRNLWKLSRWIDPVRLRMEFLNATRNAELYPNDPLAPHRYPPATLFATVFCANPLGWFEASNLPESVVEAIAPWVQTWKDHRTALFGGTIHPIGNPPDGLGWCGFLGLDANSRPHAILLFRGLLAPAECTLPMPVDCQRSLQADVHGSSGSLRITGQQIQASIPEPLGFLFATLSEAQPQSKHRE